ncbi:MAG TPA: hypothetical protein PLC55_13385, partial [Zoogloea sp.]|nr:hypothetical protein [Zoogloea sp.]
FGAGMAAADNDHVESGGMKHGEPGEGESGERNDTTLRCKNTASRVVRLEKSGGFTTAYRCCSASVEMFLLRCGEGRSRCAAMETDAPRIRIGNAEAESVVDAAICDEDVRSEADSGALRRCRGFEDDGCRSVCRRAIRERSRAMQADRRGIESWYYASGREIACCRV